MFEISFESYGPSINIKAVGNVENKAWYDYSVEPTWTPLNQMTCKTLQEKVQFYWIFCTILSLCLITMALISSGFQRHLVKLPMTLKSTGNRLCQWDHNWIVDKLKRGLTLRYVDQKSLTFFFIQIARVFIPSEMVTKENPRKRPRQPPNSANKEVKGYRSTW